MNYTVEKLEKSQIKFNYTVSVEEYNKAVDAVYAKTKHKYNVPGFRKGHAPKKVIEGMYGVGVFMNDAINQLIDDSIVELDKSGEYDLVAFGSVEDVDFKEDGSVVYALTMIVKPDVTLGEYKGLAVEKVAAKVSAKQVDEFIANEQGKQARIVDVEKAAENGNLVLIDYVGTVDGEKFDGGSANDYELELGSNTFIPGFEDQLIGTKAGEQKDVKVTFPTEYHAENLAGKEANFACTVKAVRVKELPELNDDFAKEVSEFDTLAEYKADVKAKLLEQETRKAEREYEDAIVEKIVDGSTVEIPEAMIMQEADEMVHDMEYRLQYQGMTLDMYLKYLGMTREQLASEYKPQAEKTVKVRLVMEELVKKENIGIEDKDVDARLEKMAEETSQTVEEVKKSLHQEDLNYIVNSVMSEKLMNKLKELNPSKAAAKKATKAVEGEENKAEEAEKPAKKAPAKKKTAASDDTKAEEKKAPAKKTAKTTATKPADAE